MPDILPNIRIPPHFSPSPLPSAKTPYERGPGGEVPYSAAAITALLN
jgi:hypothetical protein